MSCRARAAIGKRVEQLHRPLRLTQTCPVHQIHVSSPSVYFPSSVGDRFNVTELDPMPTAEQHETYYVRTKLMAEYEVDKGACAGLGTVILRPRGIFGPGTCLRLQVWQPAS